MDFERKYTKKDILIIGGGTSTMDVKWESLINDSTYIWSCNDFYLNSRVREQNLDLYQLSFTTDLYDKSLIEYLNKVQPFTYFEPQHFRNKWQTEEFKLFKSRLDYDSYAMNIDIGQLQYSIGQRAGAVLRLITLALSTNASNIYFVGFDGFNRDFNNSHAFSGHKGLKDTDTRRDWEKDYYNVFMEAYILLGELDKDNRLQNLGEGLSYNLGTEASKKYFPLRKEIYEKIR